MISSINLIQEYAVTTQLGHLTQLAEEKQNADYQGYTFSLQETTYRSRLAKLTPKKKGYFVAFWEKDNQHKNQAYDEQTTPEKICIVIIDDHKKGLFIFPKDIFLKQHILRTSSQKGKMALRVYPTWENDLNLTATKTQKWQIPYFLDLSTI